MVRHNREVIRVKVGFKMVYTIDDRQLFLLDDEVSLFSFVQQSGRVRNWSVLFYFALNTPFIT